MVAGGVLGWPTGAILTATLPEMMWAMDGWKKARGLETGTAPKQPAMTRAELDTLLEKHG